MGEEILKIELSELLKTVRFKRSTGPVIEGSGSIDTLRDRCAELRDSHGQDAGQALLNFVNAANWLTESGFPFKIEFAVVLKT